MPRHRPRAAELIAAAGRQGSTGRAQTAGRYEPPANHTVAWVAVHRGKLATPEVVDQGELAVFEESNAALEFEALEDTGFILGSAVKHPHDLVLGYYSVHTSKDALARGEARIAEIGKRLRVEGRI